MKKTSCSLMVLSLAALSPSLIWSAEAPGLSAISKIPAVVEIPPSEQTPSSPEAQKLGLDAARPSEDTVFTAAEGIRQAPGITSRDEPASYQNWIDGVRAQRKARLEEHREAMEARRSYHAPWDPQYESIDMQREKLREARQMHNERREQAQREYRRWTNPHSEFMKEMHDARRQLMETEAEQQRMQADLLWQRQQDWMFGPMPHGWNNPWYFRGY